MNEIKEKRKELEKVIIYNQCFEYAMHKADISQAKVEAFNLGVEMARKEFLEFLENWNWNDKCYMCLSHKESFKELKQSLGEKTE